MSCFNRVIHKVFEANYGRVGGHIRQVTQVFSQNLRATGVVPNLQISGGNFLSFSFFSNLLCCQAKNLVL